MNRYAVMLMLGFFSLNSAKPVWIVLDQMCIEEKHNSIVDLVLEPNATQESWSLAYSIEDHWNTGKYEEALELFSKLATLTNPDRIVIHNTWRTPIPTFTQDRWGDDVRIGNRDSVETVNLDIHLASGNLFVVIMYRAQPLSRYSMNFSSDGGLTWLETANNISSQDLFCSASVYGDYCYVAYADHIEGRIRRYECATGSPAMFSNGQYEIDVFSASDDIMEIALTSFADGGGNRLYYFGNTVMGDVLFYWSDSLALDWEELSPTVHLPACKSLDACTNQDHTYYLLFTYIDWTDRLCIYGRRVGSWDSLYTTYLGDQCEFAAISAYQDTIVCVFDYSETPTRRIKGIQSNNGAVDWGTFDILDSLSCSPDITLRNGGGVGLAYQNHWYDDGNFLGGSYSDWYNNYSYYFTEHDYVDYTRPSIEYLGNGNYGVVYIGHDVSGLACAYFDRNDWTGVKENSACEKNTDIMTLAPNPSTGSATLFYHLEKMSNVRISIYDITGRLLDVFVNGMEDIGNHSITVSFQNYPAGTYFIQVETPEINETKSLLIIK